MILYKNLLKTIEEKGIECDLNNIQKAYEMAYNLHKGEYRKSGEDYIIHPLCVATILVEMESNESCIIGGLLHEVIEKNTAITLGEIREELGDNIVKIIQEVTRLNEMGLEELSKEVTNLDNNCVLIKLADRLHNMRTIKYMESDRLKEKAKETIEFFSPIATRLGISKIKTELDDLALKYL